MIKKGIRGEYCFEITFQNMFINTKIKTKRYKNIITNNGIKFFLTKLFDPEWNFYSIAHGVGTTKPTKEDTELEELTFHNIDIKYEVNGNILTLKTETAGYNLNNTTEIGVYYITPTENKLISRNVHQSFVLPDTSYISTKYYYILSTAEYFNDWTLVTGKNNTYSMSMNYPQNSVIEADTCNGYHRLEDITDIDSTPGSYYYDSEENILYIHCSDSAEPSTHQILINY